MKNDVNDDPKDLHLEGMRWQARFLYNRNRFVDVNKLIMRLQKLRDKLGSAEDPTEKLEISEYILLLKMRLDLVHSRKAGAVHRSEHEQEYEELVSAVYERFDQKCNDHSLSEEIRSLWCAHKRQCKITMRYGYTDDELVRLKKQIEHDDYQVEKYTDYSPELPFLDKKREDARKEKYMAKPNMMESFCYSVKHVCNNT